MKQLLFVTFLAIALSSCASETARNSVVADPKATQETVNLFNHLMMLKDKGVMFGHQDDLSYGIGWVYPDGESDVKRVCTDFPAVIGMDLGHLEFGPAHNLDTVYFNNMRTFARLTYERGGVVTFSWHCDNPLTGGNAWDISSDKVAASVLPGGKNNEKYKQWLDHLADYFLSLTDSNGNLIPVIFRPYHEHTGSWFWWGQKLCTTDEYIGLWRFTVDYLCKTRNVHNLLFAYSAAGDFADVNEYLERYPGDAYIDILGFDYYYKPTYIEDVKNRLAIIEKAAADHHKIPALTETGYESIPDSTWWTKTVWPAVKDSKISYLLVWRNAWNKPGHFYAPYPGQVSEKDFVKFYKMPETLFLNDVAKELIYK